MDRCEVLGSMLGVRVERKGGVNADLWAGANDPGQGRCLGAPAGVVAEQRCGHHGGEPEERCQCHHSLAPSHPHRSDTGDSGREANAAGGHLTLRADSPEGTIVKRG
jgi:hypothetical protein